MNSKRIKAIRNAEHNYSEKDTKRFWSHVNKSKDKTKCWEWLASTYTDGYGRVNHHHLKVVA